MRLRSKEQVVRSGELYGIREIKLRLGLSDSAWRELVRGGLPLVRWGKRIWAIGHQVIHFFERGLEHAKSESESRECGGPGAGTALELPEGAPDQATSGGNG